MKPDLKNIDEVVKRYMPSAKTQDMESDIGHVFHRLESRDRAGDHSAEENVLSPAPGVPFRWRLAVVSVAAAALLAIFIGTIVRQPPRPFAVVESVDGPLYRLIEGKPNAVQAGAILDSGETVRSSGNDGGTLKLADGSRVEMRSQSEFSLERADDGIQIHLIRGSIIVNAARQSAGHLYVKTKDVTVSVVGTVFLVNTEEKGSRVAVIEGEVRVQQGTTEKTLQIGEQVKTNPLMESKPVGQEISWSRHAETHMALLRQAVVLTTFQNAPEERVAFQEVSIRPRPSSANSGGRGSPGLSVECALVPQIDPSRFFLRNSNAYTLVAMAYVRGGCLIARELNLISGGADWVRSDRFDVEAIMPPGTPQYTSHQLWIGEAPGFQRMLQTLLADRFKLVVRREMKEMPAYVLTPGPELRLKPWKAGDTVKDPDTGKELERGCGVRGIPDQNGQTASQSINCWNVTMAAFVNILEFATHRPVLDRTGITGEFEFNVEFSEPDYAGAFPSSLRSVSAALRDQFGLKLEASKERVEVLMIERVEKPSEN